MSQFRRERSPAADHFVKLALKFLQCERELRNWIREIVAPLELTENAFFVLVLYQEAESNQVPSRSQAEIAAALGISQGQLSQLAERLRKGGWIEAHRDAQDRRRQFWALTESGQAKLQSLVDQLIDPRKAHQLVHQLQNLTDGFQAFQQAVTTSTPATSTLPTDYSSNNKAA